jgi:hypothetical protein
MKIKDTFYKGYRFRSRLEARWAVCFDALGIRWDYEPEGFVLDDGTCYLPDFLLHGLVGRYEGDLFVEVKGSLNDYDCRKIKGFVCPDENGKPTVPLLVLSGIPEGETYSDIINDITVRAYQPLVSESGGEVYPFNFETVDGDHQGAHLGVDMEGRPHLFGDTLQQLEGMDGERVVKAYAKARQARFEYGQTPIGGKRK